MRPPARPRAAGTARPRPADQGAATQDRGGPEADHRGRDLQDEARRDRSVGGRPGGDRQETGRSRPARQERPATGATPSAGGRVGVVSDQLADRLAERTAMARYRVWRRIGWTAFAVAVAAGLGWAALVSPLFALDAEQVRVTGEGTTVDVGEVREAVTDEAGVPLPRLDTVGLREEILAMNAVKNVRITRAWPDGLTVELTSREPVAAVPQPGDVYALMDAEGVRVGTAEEVPDGLPSIVTSLSDAGAGRRALDAALAVLGALPPKLAADITTVSAATQDDVRTTLSDGRVIRWGSGADVPLKTKVAQTLLRAEPTATTVDVSSPGLPVTH
ncbi:FtsQ-type POTRA domain-containing protein [Promicromonospora sp. MEB111]|uniref:cell division protein FtsQ/DivIB n=1 Tax=Promicromonospora sp. MEB111 TaxID=3040301 RepID=UPI00254E4C7F|nr:FtsQ-type POTRA domain-containing protein [Promicromonospora sp. MEB111]